MQLKGRKLEIESTKTSTVQQMSSDIGFKPSENEAILEELARLRQEIEHLKAQQAEQSVV